MKQVEFDETLRLMRVEREQKTSRLKTMMAELDVEISKKGEHIHNMQAEYEGLKLQKKMLAKEKNRIESEYSEKYQNFIRNNEGHVTRNLCDVSDWAIVNELAARGYTLEGGGLSHKDRAQEWLDDYNKKLQPKEDDGKEVAV